MSLLKRRTSKQTKESRQRMMELRVHSPRIVLFQWLGRGLRVVKVACLMLVVGFLGFVGKGAWDRLFYQNVEEFGLTDIVLTNGQGEATRFLTIERVETMTGMKRGGDRTIFSYDLDEVRSQLTALPEISMASVERRLPGTIRIQVHERIPQAWLTCPTLGLEERSRENGLLLDQNGIPFRCDAVSIWEWGQELPAVYIGELEPGSIVEGQDPQHEGLTQALELVAKVSDRRVRNPNLARLEWIMIKDEIHLEAMFRNGPRATFSFYDLDRQLESLDKVLDHARQRGEYIASVNLIPHRLVPVRYH